MNETIKNLIERRSCRQFLKEVIKDEELQKILTAGTYAPSGMGRQSAVIIAIENQDVIKELSIQNAKIMGQASDPFYGASTVVAVLADKTIATHVEDGSLVLGNMMNAAYSLGIGSCWIHRAKETFETNIGKKLLAEWGLSDNYVGIGFCILGYPAKPYLPAKPRKKDYIRIIH